MAIKFDVTDDLTKEVLALWEEFEHKKAKIIATTDEEVRKLEEEYEKRSDAIHRKYEMMGIMTSVAERRYDSASFLWRNNE